MSFFDRLFGGHGGGHGSGHRAETHDPHHGGAYANRPPGGGGISCSTCRALNPMDAKFCQQCGNSTQPARCTQCATPLIAGTRFCSQCGKQAN